MFAGKTFAFLLPACLLCAASLCAQQNESSSTSISLDVVVTPKSGPPVANLEKNDFTILDNKSPQQLTAFRAIVGDQATIHVILVIDAVNVTYESLAYQRGAIDKFLHSDGGHLAQPTALAFFTDKGTQIQEGFSTDGNQLSASLDQYAVGLRDIRRSSQFEANDRFQLSINALRSLTERAAALPGRKMIFWVSPGWPLLSGPGIELDSKQQNRIFATVVGLSTELRQARITLYDIDPLGPAESLGRTNYYEDFVKGLPKPEQAQVGDISLQVVATQSGGLVLTGNNDIAGLLKQCMADTEAYYEISFTGVRADHRDEYHHIEVKLAKSGLTARTREGYYAQP